MSRCHQVVSLYLVTLLCGTCPASAARRPAHATTAAKKDVKEDRRTRKAKLFVAQAEAALAKGRPAEALQLYQQAYDAQPMPALLYQIGKCHQGMGNAGRAAFSYRQYLKYGANADNRPEVEELAARMEELAAEVRGDGLAPEAKEAPETKVAPAGKEEAAVGAGPVRANNGPSQNQEVETK